MAAVEGTFQRQQPFRASVPINVPVLESHKVKSLTMNLQTTDRPSSALTRGIQITEFKDSRVNPEPVALEESEILLEEYLSPRKLRALTGVENLHEVKYLEMKVDTRDTSLGNFGSHLPMLSQLKLSGSIISQVRDLGSSLNSLRVLWLARCGVEDLDGLSAMNSLKELYLAYNDVCDISPCSLLENLVILDLEGNNIEEISQVHFLNSCALLRNLTLEGNPVCVTPSPDEASPNYDYRQSVKEAVPHLKLLDDEPFTKPTEARKTASVFEDDWALIDELLSEGTMAGSDDSLDNSNFGSVRPGTSMRPMTGARPGAYTGTGIRPGTRAGSRPGTSARLGTGIRPGTSRLGTAGGNRPGSAGRPGSGEEVESTEDASDLTRGGVVCGNPSKALRARHKPDNTQNRAAAKMLAEMKLKSDHNIIPSTEDESPEVKELFTELKEWRESYAVKQKIIDDSKAPQVLTIDHDDAVSLSDDDEIITSDEEETETPPSSRQSGIREDVHEKSVNSINGNTGASSYSGSQDARPKSRTRRDSWKSRSRSKNQYDESFDAPEDGMSLEPSDESSPVSKPHGYPSSHPKSRSLEHIRGAPQAPKSPSELRPLSNPAVGSKGKFRLEPFVDKHKPKTIDPLNPIIRASVHSPEGPKLPEGPRADTAVAALGSALPPPARIRKGLHNVQLLPSKFTK